MAKNYIDNHDGTYTIENPTTCCQFTTKVDLQNNINSLTATIAQLQARLVELQADKAAIDAL